MEIRELIAAISQKHKETGIVINPPASENEIQRFERQVGFALPEDFKEFYAICNGFSCAEDLYNMTSLSEIRNSQREYGKN